MFSRKETEAGKLEPHHVAVLTETGRCIRSGLSLTSASFPARHELGWLFVGLYMIPRRFCGWRALITNALGNIPTTSSVIMIIPNSTVYVMLRAKEHV